MGKYHVFLSCEEDILIDDKPIQDFLNSLLTEGRDVDIKCIRKHENLELSKEDLKDLKDSSIYVVNTHKDLDYITSWELGYAMGIGIKIIGYFDGKNAIKIPSDVKGLIHPVPPDVSRFVEILTRSLEKFEAKKSLFEDWDMQEKTFRKEAGATL